MREKTISQFQARGALFITLHRAMDLAKGDLLSSDPYVEATVLPLPHPTAQQSSQITAESADWAPSLGAYYFEHSLKTRVINANLNPVWEEVCPKKLVST